MAESMLNLLEKVAEKDDGVTGLIKTVEEAVAYHRSSDADEKKTMPEIVAYFRAGELNKGFHYAVKNHYSANSLLDTDGSRLVLALIKEKNESASAVVMTLGGLFQAKTEEKSLITVAAENGLRGLVQYFIVCEQNVLDDEKVFCAVETLFS